MDIKGVGNNYSRYTELYKKQEQASSRQTQQKTDKLELSDAAKKLKSEGIDAQLLNEVKTKIESGYYNRDEVINKVADEIIKKFSEEK
ncbi:MAG: flagellar biosynthesis anti-sigma factor FlgM [Ignavibacteriae bacterium]|nr:flagellar biosynthesis anti-sigma factor FlgM [Ignavibacteriota bacterium]